MSDFCVGETPQVAAVGHTRPKLKKKEVEYRETIYSQLCVHPQID